MYNENQGRFNWGELIIGILMVIAGIMCLKNPILSAQTLVFFFAFIAIMRGIYQLTIRSRFEAFVGLNGTWSIFIGIINIIAGAFLLFNSMFGVALIPFIFAVWFIVESITLIVIAFQFRFIETNASFWGTLVLGILGVTLGIFLLRNPNTALISTAVLVTTYFIIIGVSYVFISFRN